MVTRNPHFIGNGEYLIYYKEPMTRDGVRFKGICENFNPSGVCAFWNEEKEQMLLVVYRDIIGLYPVEKMKKIPLR